jgi:flagella basal body P-ring formation protein FlgA
MTGFRTVFNRIILAPMTVALLFAWFGGAAGAAEFSVTVRPSAEVTGDEIRLGDVADIAGPDSALKNDLADVYLTRAPRPGESTLIRLAYLEHRLTTSGLPLDQASWTLPAQIQVTRKSQGIDEAWVRQVMEEYLSSVEPYMSGVWELVNVRVGKLPKLPEGDLDYRLAPNPSANPSSVNLNIYLTVDGREEAALRVSGKVELKVMAVVAARRLEKGRKMEAGDLLVTRVSTNRLRTGALTELDSAVGMTSRREIQAGDPIMGRDLYREAIVHRGDVVTILARAGALKVSSTGEARQDGAVGESVKVVNVNSNITIIAKVVGPNTVEVHF